MVEFILRSVTRGTPLVVQGTFRIRLPMQVVWVQPLVEEDPACLGAAKPLLCSWRTEPSPRVLRGSSSIWGTRFVSLMADSCALPRPPFRAW